MIMLKVRKGQLLTTRALLSCSLLFSDTVLNEQIIQMYHVYMNVCYVQLSQK